MKKRMYHACESRELREIEVAITYEFGIQGLLCNTNQNFYVQ